jgi:gas vesicle protein
MLTMGKSTGKKVAVGTLIAAGVGYLAGILTAPKSGKETRQDVHDAAVKAKRDAEVRLKALHSELNELIEKGKSHAETAKKSSKVEVEKALAAANVAREKVREVLSAIHEGESEDQDLNKAIDEVTKATSHLKKFMSKQASTKSAKKTK